MQIGGLDGWGVCSMLGGGIASPGLRIETCGTQKQVFKVWNRGQEPVKSRSFTPPTPRRNRSWGPKVLRSDTRNCDYRLTPEAEAKPEACAAGMSAVDLG